MADIILTEGDDVWNGTEAPETVYGLGGNDIINGGDGDDYLVGGAGDDILDGGDGKNYLDGGDGNDILHVSQNNYAAGGAGNDQYYLLDAIENLSIEIYESTDKSGGIDTVFIDPNGLGLVTFSLSDKGYNNAVENVTILPGTNGSVYGNDLDNVMTGNTFVDNLRGGNGNDTLIGNGGNDSLDGGNGNDILNGNEGNDTLFGRVDNDGLYGGDGDDTLWGGLGDDIHDGGTGADMMAGNVGNDKYYVDNVGDRVFEDSVVGIDVVSSSISFALGGQHIENILLTGSASINATGNALNNYLVGNSGSNIIDGGAGIDILHGEGGDDKLVGGAGNDTLVGGAGDDELLGGDGDDSLGGGAGTDTMAGGAGNDKYYVDDAGSIILEDNGAGTDVVASSISFALGGQHVENILLTGTGNINASGNALNNYLVGNSGANIISGGGGNDTLAGGTGSDTFVFNTALNSNSNCDTITDFNVVADTIWLDKAIFTLWGNGSLPTGAFHIGEAAADSNDRIIYNSSTGALYYDTNGSFNGGSVQFAKLSAGLALTSADFLIV
ncbi:calcium-binding protein [Phyllobacterium sp. YR531]|uniref:calcium-binding protein n=1 Tax=Phyllobacterium sp. YR531 TaxID=1144343 RepID=UPI00026F529A|nr:calcium-binding protein [Phyllobacterium sp. YR531]EJN02463.1 putative calcium-binding protein [Phyllobacterium sp. YR531]